MHQIATFNLLSRGSMLALAFSPYRGLDVKKSNSLLAIGQSNFVSDLVRSIINFSNWKIILKLRETVRNGECPEDVRVCVVCNNFMNCHYIIQVKYDIILICSIELFFKINYC